MRTILLINLDLNTFDFDWDIWFVDCEEMFELSIWLYIHYLHDHLQQAIGWIPIR
jgi:hypothetical protein